MPLAMTLTTPGGPACIAPVDRPEQDPGPGEVRIRHTVIGVNFVDVYFRTGLYPMPGGASVLGFEAAGRVEAVGAGVPYLRPGDRVAYAGMPIGAYCESRVLPASRLLALPDAIPDRVAGSSVLRGLTAHMLLHKTHAVGPGDWVLVHAVAGGLGQLVARWAVRLGARVIGTVGTASKVAIGLEAGAEAVLLHADNDWPGEARRIADGRGVHLVVDGIGGGMPARGIESLRPFGVLASIGQPAGPIPPIRVEDLSAAGRAASVSRPSVMAYCNDPDLYRHGAEALMAALADGLINPIGAEYALKEAARAHADLEAGRTTGSVILVP